MSYPGVIVLIIANKLVIYLNEICSVRFEGSWYFVIRKTNLSPTEIIFLYGQVIFDSYFGFSRLIKKKDLKPIDRINILIAFTKFKHLNFIFRSAISPTTPHTIFYIFLRNTFNIYKCLCIDRSTKQGHWIVEARNWIKSNSFAVLSVERKHYIIFINHILGKHLESLEKYKITVFTDEMNTLTKRTIVISCLL